MVPWVASMHPPGASTETHQIFNQVFTLRVDTDSHLLTQSPHGPKGVRATWMAAVSIFAQVHGNANVPRMAKASRSSGASHNEAWQKRTEAFVWHTFAFQSLLSPWLFPPSTYFFLHNVAFVGEAIRRMLKEGPDLSLLSRDKGAGCTSPQSLHGCVSRIDRWVDLNKCTFSPSILPLSH